VMGENGKSGERWMNLGAYSAVSPTYLRTMAIPIVQGRDFSEGDRGNGDGVVILDEDAARRLFPDHPNPVGRMVKLAGPENRTAPWLRVIGVALTLGRAPNAPERDPNIYVVYGRDTATTERAIVIATEQEALDMPLRVRRELGRIVGSGSRVRVERYIADHEERTRWTSFLAALYCALSLFSLVLCAVGLYGVLAYTVSLRTREFAIRIALGARQRNVARAVVHDAAVMALAGVGLGAFMALAATRPIMDTLYAGSFLEVKALLAAEIVLLAVAAAAALEPVRRGMRSDPARIIQAT
jgi:putative ABC transport system permease protein